MEHRKLDALMTPIERIARVAAAGLTSATSSVTKPSGAKSYDNADGTRTIIGNVANGESNPSYTMATHVGDTTAPGTPTGVTASSKSGVVVVEWDGTLSGGIPDDFYAVRVYLDGSELGILTGAGSVSSASLEGGTTHSVTATAEDDACLPDGTPAHNVSAPTTAISVTVSEDVESVATTAQEALDAANATGQHFWTDTDGIHVTEVTQDEWGDSTSANYHSGANVLINALGQLFRDGLNNLLGVLPSGLAIYDGNGNAQSNIVASFTSSLIEIGKNTTSAVVKLCGGVASLTYTTANKFFNITALRAALRGVSEYENTETANAQVAAQFDVSSDGDTSTAILLQTATSSAASSNMQATASGSPSASVELGSGNGTSTIDMWADYGLKLNNGPYIKGFNFGYAASVTNQNGIVTFNPGMGVKPTAVFVTHALASNETNDVAKIAVPFVWAIDSATQVQVRWKRTDSNDYLRNNAIGYYWLAIC